MRRLRKCCKHKSRNWCVTYALPSGVSLRQQLQCKEFQLGVSPYILNVSLGYSIHSVTAFVLSPWWGRNDEFRVPRTRGLRLCQQETGLEKACPRKLLLPLQWSLGPLVHQANSYRTKDGKRGTSHSNSEWAVGVRSHCWKSCPDSTHGLPVPPLRTCWPPNSGEPHHSHGNENALSISIFNGGKKMLIIVNIKMGWAFKYVQNTFPIWHFWYTKPCAKWNTQDDLNCYLIKL